MRIGIYTFTAANNYGAVLQAFALKETLNALGHETFCVDYRPRYLWDKYQPFSKLRLKNGNFLKNIMRDFFFFIWLKKKNCGYDSFRKNMLSLLSENEIGSLSTIVVGSDQVWNFKHTYGDRKFLGYIPNFKGSVVSYAASMEEVNACDLDVLRDALRNFTKISVREKSLKKTLLESFNIQSTLVLDPTLLLDKKDWQRIEIPFVHKKPYMLAYVFGISEKKRMELTNLAAEKELDLLVFCGEAKPGKGLLDSEAPQKFLSIIHNASYIVTNSFHGTAFSIIYGKKFCVIPKASNERIETLLDFADANKALLSQSKKIEYSDFVEVPEYSEQFKRMKATSIAYLESISKER